MCRCRQGTLPSCMCPSSSTSLKPKGCGHLAAAARRKKIKKSAMNCVIAVGARRCVACAPTTRRRSIPRDMPTLPWQCKKKDKNKTRCIVSTQSKKKIKIKHDALRRHSRGTLPHCTCPRSSTTLETKGHTHLAMMQKKNIKIKCNALRCCCWGMLPRCTCPRSPMRINPEGHAHLAAVARKKR